MIEKLIENRSPLSIYDGARGMLNTVNGIRWVEFSTYDRQHYALHLRDIEFRIRKHNVITSSDMIIALYDFVP